MIYVVYFFTPFLQILKKSKSQNKNHDFRVDWRRLGVFPLCSSVALLCGQMECNKNCFWSVFSRTKRALARKSAFFWYRFCCRTRPTPRALWSVSTKKLMLLPNCLNAVPRRNNCRRKCRAFFPTWSTLWASLPSVSCTTRCQQWPEACWRLINCFRSTPRRATLKNWNSTNQTTCATWNWPEIKYRRCVCATTNGALTHCAGVFADVSWVFWHVFNGLAFQFSGHVSQRLFQAQGCRKSKIANDHSL